jgi:hypothetical protein
MGVREAWGVVGGAAPDANDTRFDCIGAFSKSNLGPENSFGSCVLVAPNVIVTARHNLNACNTPSGMCYCHDTYIEPGVMHIARFRRLLPADGGGIGVPGTHQFEVPIIQWHLLNPVPGPFTEECDNNDVVVGILASPVTHIEPAVVEYSDIHDPPDGNPIGPFGGYGMYFIGGWGHNELAQLPGTLLVGMMVGRPSLRESGAGGRTGDSGGGLLYQGSCGRMRLVGITQLPYRAVPCSRMPLELRQFIPAPPSCSRQLTADGMPDPVVTGRVTATAFVTTPGFVPNQTYNAIPSGGWHPCTGDVGRCAEGVSRGSSAGQTGAFTNPTQCWYTAIGGCSGDAGFSLKATETIDLQFSVESSHNTSATLLQGGGTELLNLAADSSVGCPPNSEPFMIDIPFQVLGHKEAIIRIQVSGRILATFAPQPPLIAPVPRPDVLDDVRVAWELYQDIGEVGLDPTDPPIGNANCAAFQTTAVSPIPFGLKLSSLSVLPGSYILRVKPIVDVHLRAGVKGCDPPEVAGAPDIDVDLFVKVIADSY